MGQLTPTTLEQPTAGADLAFSLALLSDNDYKINSMFSPVTNNLDTSYKMLLYGLTKGVIDLSKGDQLLWDGQKFEKTKGTKTIIQAVDLKSSGDITLVTTTGNFIVKSIIVNYTDVTSLTSDAVIELGGVGDTASVVGSKALAGANTDTYTNLTIKENAKVLTDNLVLGRTAATATSITANFIIEIQYV